MSFGDFSARYKQKTEAKEAATAPPPRDYDELNALRDRIVGVLLQDARRAHDLSEQDCASEVGVPLEYYRDWEAGKRSPTLPQLELLAYKIGVPVSYFWNTTTISAAEPERKVPAEAFTDLRDRVIGTLIRARRLELNLTADALATQSGLSGSQIEAMELARLPVTFATLTTLASALKVPLGYFMEDTSRIGDWLHTQEEYDRFTDMPDELREWVLQPTNQPFIEIAMKLSKLPVNDLRGVGENILNITL